MKINPLQDAVHDQILAELHEMRADNVPSDKWEETHYDAVGLLLDMLKSLGYNDIVEAYDEVGEPW